jgi:tetratricopeptide (TPR) repeat protein
LRSAEWYRDRLSDAKAAERALVEARELDPEPLEAHAELVALLREQQRSAELVAALRAWAVVEPVAEKRTSHLREAAAIALEALSEPELAAECYQELLSIDRTDAEGLRALCEIRSGQSRWNEVVGLLERRLDVASDDTERASLAKSVGAVYLEHLGDSRAAIEAYEAALDFKETDTEALNALEQLYEQNDRIEALRSLLQRRCELVDDQERAELQLRLAKLYEHSFRDQTAAIAMLREVVRFDPNREEAVQNLERLLEAAEAWDELVASLLSRVEHATQEEQRGLLERVAEIHEDRRHDPDSAIQTYERINAEIGADERSLRALASLYERGDEWAKVAGTLEQLAATLDGQPAIELCHRVADLWADKIGDLEQSDMVLRAAYERFPWDRDTRERLKAHYESKGDYRALVGVLDDELETLSADQERVALLRSISDVYRDRLEDPGTAATYLEKAVGLDREDRAALVPLCDLYMAAGRQQDAVPILRQIIESFGRTRSKELATHHHRLGQALESLGDAEGALAAYDAAFKVDLTNVEILRDLGKLTLAEGHLGRAQKSFRALLLQKLEPSSGIRKADVYYYLGDIAARQDDKRKAITMLERALAEDKSHDQASQLLAQLKG